MKLEVQKTPLDGVLLIKPCTLFEDFRGNYTELYNKRLYEDAGISQEFIQDDISTSSRAVLRGIHGDQDTWKLVSCLHGTFYLVVVNWDESSKQYRKWCSFTLSDQNRMQVLIPPRFGNGHVVMSEKAIFFYKQTTLYTGADRQFTIKWNDPSLDIFWPVRDPITSKRDEGFKA